MHSTKVTQQSYYTEVNNFYHQENKHSEICRVEHSNSVFNNQSFRCIKNNLSKR